MSRAARLKGLFKGSGLRARSLRASALTVGAFGSGKVLQLASNLILTRILFPEAFGLMALVSVFTSGLALLSDIGIRPSIVRSARGDDPNFLATAWTLKIVRGFALTIGAWLLAWPYAAVYDNPLLFQLICVTALSSSAAGFYSIEGIRRARHLHLGRNVALEFVNNATSISITILFAWWTQSVWGLVIGNVVGNVLRSILSHVILPSAHHRLRWDRSVVSEIVHFGKWILFGTLFTFFGSKGLQAVRGTLVDLDTLGLLHVSMMFATMLGDLVSRVLSSVGFPAISDVVRGGRHDLRKAVGKIRNLQMMFSLPIYFALVAVAQPMIDLLYDDRYAAAGTYFALMALSSAVGGLSMAYQNAFLALGDSRIHAAIMLSLSTLKILGIFVGFSLGGVIGMLVADAVASSLVFALSTGIAVRKGIANLRADLLAYGAISVVYAIYWSTLP